VAVDIEQAYRVLDEASPKFKKIGTSARKAMTDVDKASKSGRDSLGRFTKGAGKASKGTQLLAGQLKKLGAALVAGAIAKGLTGAANAAIDLESAFAGVKKTLPETADFEAITQGLRDMSKEIPTSAVGLAKIAEVAGQLGVQGDEILSFTRVMADLAETTNLAGEEGATALARFANIIDNQAGPQFERLGSTIVDLGNNLATTEAEILSLSTRIAAAGNLAGLSEADILAFSGALSSVGVQAEAGGTAFSTFLSQLKSAAISGGESLAGFAAVAGKSVGDFQRLFKEDAAGAVTTFIEGLSKIENQSAALDKLGFKGARVQRVFLSLAGAGDLTRTAIERGTAAFEANTALADEAATRYATLASRLAVLRNRFQDAVVSVGQGLTPAISGLLDVLDRQDVIEAFGDAWTEVKNALGLVADGANLALEAFRLIFRDPSLTFGDLLAVSIITASNAIQQASLAVQAFFVASAEIATAAIGQLVTSLVDGIDGALDSLANIAFIIPGMEDTAEDILQLRQDLAGLAQDTGIAGGAFNVFGDATAALDERLTAISERSRALSQATTDLTEVTGKSAKATRDYKAAADEAPPALDRLGTSSDTAAGGITRLGEAAQTSSGLIGGFLGVADDLASGFGQIQAELEDLASGPGSFRAMSEEMAQLQLKMAALAATGQELSPAYTDARDKLEELTRSFREATIDGEEMARILVESAAEVPPQLAEIGEATGEVGTSVSDLAVTWTDSFASMLTSGQGFVASIQGAFSSLTGGGGLGGIISGLFGGGGGGALGSLLGGTGIGQALQGLIGPLSAALGPFGPLVSAVAPIALKGISVLGKKIFGGIKKLFGGKDRKTKFKESLAGFGLDISKSLGAELDKIDEGLGRGLGARKLASALGLDQIRQEVALTTATFPSFVEVFTTGLQAAADRGQLTGEVMTGLQASLQLLTGAAGEMGLQGTAAFDQLIAAAGAAGLEVDGFAASGVASMMNFESAGTMAALETQAAHQAAATGSSSAWQESTASSSMAVSGQAQATVSAMQTATMAEVAGAQKSAEAWRAGSQESVAAIDTIAPAAESAVGAVEAASVGASGAMAAAANSAASAAASAASRVAGSIASVVGSASRLQGIHIGGIDGIDGLAHGGPFRGGQPILVGEEGPEVAVFPRAGEIIPLQSSGSPSVAVGGVTPAGAGGGGQPIIVESRLFLDSEVIDRRTQRTVSAGNTQGTIDPPREEDWP